MAKVRELRLLGMGVGSRPPFFLYYLSYVYQSIGPDSILRKFQRLLQTQDGLASDLYSIIVYYSRVWYSVLVGLRT